MIEVRQRTPWVRTIVLAFYTLGFVIVGVTIPCANNEVICYTIKGLLFGLALILIYVLIWQVFNKRRIRVNRDEVIISNRILSKVKKIYYPLKLEIKSFSQERKFEHSNSFFQLYGIFIRKLVRLILFKNIYYKVELIGNGKNRTLIQDLSEQDAKKVLKFMKEEMLGHVN